jgi:phosphoserine phosphatase
MKVVCLDFDDVLTDKGTLSRLAFVFGPSFSEIKLAMELFEDNKNPKKFFKVVRKIIKLGQGVKYSRVQEVVKFLKLNKNAKAVLRKLKSAGCKIVIVSTNDEKLIRNFLEKNKISKYIDHVYAARLVVKNGLLTGEITGDVIRTEKVGIVNKIEDLYKVKRGQIIYVGDGLTDLPIMKKVGRGILFCPNPVTNAEALTDKQLLKMQKNGRLFLVEDRDLNKILPFVI